MTGQPRYKGVILAGGRGTRLYPATRAMSKQLLPVYDKPMIFYPLSILMLAGLRDILIITTPQDAPLFQAQLGDGAQWGLSIAYAEQAEPRGLAEALIIAEPFLDHAGCTLILGDNIFYGPNIGAHLADAMTTTTGATIFTYPVLDPRAYGVVAYDDRRNVVDVVEKPADPPSTMAVTGLYVFAADAVAVAQAVVPSARGELEITDVIRSYLRQSRLSVRDFGRGFAWFDAGTHESLLDAANFVHTVSARQGLQVACLEEIAWRMGWLSRDAVLEAADALGGGAYTDYLRMIVDQAR